jgi:uncharacterized protein (DUF433 family)
MKDRIAVDPQIHFGKPCVAGSRIPVQSVLELVRTGLTSAEIIRDYYPDLKPDDIRACVQRMQFESESLNDKHLVLPAFDNENGYGQSSAG